MLGCTHVQMVPATVGALGKARATIWCDEEGRLDGRPVNEFASQVLGEQVHGGLLHGPVIVAGRAAMEEEEQDSEEEDSEAEADECEA